MVPLALWNEAARRGLVPGPWVCELHPKQLAFFHDPAKIKAALAGRRGGKTRVGTAGLYDAALRNPGSVALYVALTQKSARRILWRELTAFDKRFALNLEFNSTEMSARLRNGSVIYISGADTESAIEKLRGLAYSRVIIDEAASFRLGLLEYLTQEVLGPALQDFEGDTWLVGSPNAACMGYFHDLTMGSNPKIKQCSTHHWTLRDNPRFAGRADRVLAQELEKRGWTMDCPAFRREYGGLWIKDDSFLVYQFDRARNLTQSAPKGLPYVLGVDLGSSADKPSTAFAILAYDAQNGVTYVAKVYSRGDMTSTDIAEEIKALDSHYHFERMVMDPGGLGGAYISECRRRYRLPVEPATKNAKAAYIELLNADYRQGNLRIVESECKPLLDEVGILQWNPKRSAPVETMLDHCCDAHLYAWRACRAWQAPERQPEGPHEVVDENEKKLEAKLGRRKR